MVSSSHPWVVVWVRYQGHNTHDTDTIMKNQQTERVAVTLDTRSRGINFGYAHPRVINFCCTVPVCQRSQAFWNFSWDKIFGRFPHRVGSSGEMFQHLKNSGVLARLDTRQDFVRKWSIEKATNVINVRLKEALLIRRHNLELNSRSEFEDFIDFVHFWSFYFCLIMTKALTPNIWSLLSLSLNVF